MSDLAHHSCNNYKNDGSLRVLHTYLESFILEFFIPKYGLPYCVFLFFNRASTCDQLYSAEDSSFLFSTKLLCDRDIELLMIHIVRVFNNYLGLWINMPSHENINAVPWLTILTFYHCEWLTYCLFTKATFGLNKHNSFYLNKWKRHTVTQTDAVWPHNLIIWENLSLGYTKTQT